MTTISDERKTQPLERLIWALLLERATFDKLKMKPIDEITPDDRLPAETLLASLTEKIAKIGEINFKILDITESSDEALEAEIQTR